MQMQRFRQLLVSTAIIGCAVTASAAADAATATGTLTADNHYGLYVGNEDGTELRFVGRNELGAGGSPGTYNWSEPESYSFDINPGEYLYVVAWNVELENGFIGEFSTPTRSFLTNTSDWQVLSEGGANPNLIAGDLPVVGEVKGLINNGYTGALSWMTPDDLGSQGTSPWGTISDIDAAARFIWGTIVGGDVKYRLFRTAAVAHTPIPAALPMFAAGLFGLAMLRRRQRKSA